MFRIISGFLFLVSAGVTLVSSGSALSQVGQPTPKVKPTLSPVAETRLIMEGLAQANFRGLEKLLKTEPTSVQSWTFARGQALLIAETSNLLLIRPPKGQGQDLWFDRAMALRVQATLLAQAIAAKDYAKSKILFVNLGKACTNCHQSFNVPVQIIPFAVETGQLESVGLKP